MTTSRRSLLGGLLGIAINRAGTLDPNPDIDEGPFSRSALADRAEALGVDARALYPAGDPRAAMAGEIAKAFREGRCRYVPQFAKLTTIYDQIYWSRRFYEIFPNGSRLADLLVRLDNTDVAAPKFPASIDEVVRDYYAKSDETPLAAQVVTDPHGMPDREPLRLSRFSDKLWAAVEATGRIDAARAATAHAQASARYIAPSIARWLDASPVDAGNARHAALIPIEIARYGALWAIVEDVVGPSAIEPLVIALSAGYVPVGEIDERFVVATKALQDSLTMVGLNA